MKKSSMILAVLGLMVAPSMAAIGQFGTAATSHEEITSGGEADSLTLAAFGGGVGNYVVVSIGSKPSSDASDGVTGVLYGTTELDRIAYTSVTESGYTVSAYLYGGFVSAASADIVMSYTLSDANDFDGIAMTASSWSGSAGFSAARGANASAVNVGPLSTSTLTIGANSVIMSATAMGGPSGDASSTFGSVIATMSGARASSVLTAMDAAVAGTYTPQVDWALSSGRNAIVSGELLAAPESAAVTPKSVAVISKPAVVAPRSVAEVSKPAAVAPKSAAEGPEPATVSLIGLGTLVSLLIRRVPED